MEQITSEVRDDNYHNKIKEWILISKCLANTCDLKSHLSPSDLDGIAKRFLPLPLESMDVTDEDVPDQVTNHAIEIHCEIVERSCSMMMHLSGTSKLAKCVQVRKETPLLH